jgi:hypothetical protein
MERWGSLAVDDHKDALALAINVLLYDRLVIPVCTDQDDRDEHDYWYERGWEPDLQNLRLEQLDDLAVRRPWDAARRALFRSRYAELKAERADADADRAASDETATRAVTRHLLAQERLPGEDRVNIIAAYGSLSAIENDFVLQPTLERNEQLEAQSLLITRRLAVPDCDPEEALEKAIRLSRDRKFQRHRRALFDWQESFVVRGISPEAAIAELIDLSDQYNDAVAAAYRDYGFRALCTILGVGAGLASAVPAGAWLGVFGASISLIQFAVTGGASVDSGEAQPAAMFHDIESVLGARWR